MSFPTLSCTPVKIDYEYLSSVIKSEFEKGYVQTRQRHNRDIQKLGVSYMVEIADLTLILEHYESVRQSVIFTFNGLNVRYSTPPKYAEDGAMQGLYNVTFDLEQV